jgi:ATP/maltotriose-dependent transcriptional regulator MalT
LARKLGVPDALFKAAFAMLFQGTAQHWEERVRVASESVGWPREGVNARTLAPLLWYAGRVQLDQGDRAQAEVLWREVQDLAERTREPLMGLLVLRRDIVLAILAGNLEDAVTLLRRFVQRSDESGSSVAGRQFTLSMLLAPALHLGRADAWLAVFDEFSNLAGPAAQAIAFTDARAVCLAHVGQLEEARTVVGARLDGVAGGGEDQTHMYALVWLVQAAVALEHREAARSLMGRLAGVAHLALGEGAYTCLARHLGDAAALLGDVGTARTYFVQALETAGQVRFRPEVALAHMRLAELQLQDTERGRSEAVEHLDIAIPELRDMRMQPALERALVLRDELRGAPSVSDVLTTRERQIATLLAAGLSNREIGEQLVITEGTVEVHVKHILGKLGVTSRTQVAGRP